MKTHVGARFARAAGRRFCDRTRARAPRQSVAIEKHILYFGSRGLNLARGRPAFGRGMVTEPERDSAQLGVRAPGTINLSRAALVRQRNPRK